MIGFSAGADAALIFADNYRAHQVENRTSGRITDIAILAGTMTDETQKLQTEGFRILTDLLLWETDIYILDDSAAYGAEAADYIAPIDSDPNDDIEVGTFHFEPRTWQEHWQGGERGTGTNNSEDFRTEVFDWFRDN